MCVGEEVFVSVSEARQHPEERRVLKGFIVSRPTTLPRTESRALPPVDEFKPLYDTGNVIPPLYDPDQLSYFLEVSTEHYRAVKAKARDVVGGGWRIRAAGATEGDPEHKERLLNFFLHPNESQTFQELFEAIMTDYEALGNAYIEVVRHPTLTNDLGVNLPYKLYHLPARFMRIHSSLTMYVQKRGMKVRYFKEFGDLRIINCETGEEAGPELDPRLRATEVIHLKNYHVRSDPYGLPDFIPALGAIVGNIAARDYNLAFFSSYAVPAYAIILKNVEYDDETRALIEEFFTHTFRGPDNAHKTLILQLPPGRQGEPEPDIEFHPLQRDVRDASFKEYRISNRDEVYRAHGVPPMIGGIVETGNIGAGTGLAQMLIYKNSVIIPRQNMLMSRINGLLVNGPQGFHYEDFEFELLPPDLGEREQLAKTHEIYLKSGVYTINEVRADLGLEPVEGGDRPFIPMEGSRLTFLDELVSKSDSSNTTSNEPDKNVIKLMPRAPQQFAYLLHKVVNGHLEHKELITPTGIHVKVEDHPLGHIIRPESKEVEKALQDLFVFDDAGNAYALERNGDFYLICGLLQRQEQAENS